MKLNLLKNIYEILLYNEWANKRLIQNINLVRQDDYKKTLPVPFNSLHGLLAHLHYYDVKYYHKIVYGSSISKFDEKLSKESLSENILSYSVKWTEWIKDLISSLSNSENLENSSKHVLDLCAHNNYHRGQINVVISLLGYEPQSLDIFLYRAQLHADIVIK